MWMRKCYWELVVDISIIRETTWKKFGKPLLKRTLNVLISVSGKFFLSENNLQYLFCNKHVKNKLMYKIGYEFISN